MHSAFSGAGSDQDFANAVTDLAGEERRKFTSTGSASIFWNDRLNQACGFESPFYRKFTNYVLYK
jgi:hypothetical protein